MTIKITLDKAAVRDVPIELVTPLVQDTGQKVLRRARILVQRKSGKTRSKINGKLKVSARKVSYTVTSSDPKSLLLHGGSPPHKIQAKKGGPMLHFFWDKVGQEVTFYSVNHPGFTGSQFLVNPLIMFGERAGFKVTISPGGARGTI